MFEPPARVPGLEAPVAVLELAASADAARPRATYLNEAFQPIAQRDDIAFERMESRQPRFVRGDANADGGINVSDPVFVLQYLFSGGKTPPCVKAADADDDGETNVTDAIMILQHLFLQGDAPPEPSACGTDPTEDELPCEEFTPCR